MQKFLKALDGGSRWFAIALVIGLLLCAIAAPASAQQTIASKGIVATGSATTVTATAAHTGANGVIITMGAAFSCATTPASPILAQVKDGTTVVWQEHITSGKEVNFGTGGIGGTPGNDMSATIPTCGGGVLGSVTILYQKR